MQNRDKLRDNVSARALQAMTWDRFRGIYKKSIDLPPCSVSVGIWAAASDMRSPVPKEAMRPRTTFRIRSRMLGWLSSFFVAGVGGGNLPSMPENYYHV